MRKLYKTEWKSPIGTLALVATENGLCRIDYKNGQAYEDKLRRWAERWLGEGSWEENQEPLLLAISQLEQYFNGERTDFQLPYHLYGTSFQLQVWRALADIPFGQTCSYLDIARAIGNSKAVRAVGGANNKNPLSIVIPCHRVVGKDGSLVGYGGGLSLKEALLKLEQTAY